MPETEGALVRTEAVAHMIPAFAIVYEYRALEIRLYADRFIAAFNTAALLSKADDVEPVSIYRVSVRGEKEKPTLVLLATLQEGMLKVLLPDGAELLDEAGLATKP